MNTFVQRFHLSGSSLKIIALITMAIDHFAAIILAYGVLLPAGPVYKGGPLWNCYIVYTVMRQIGRIAFPIFCFLLVEGFVHTSNRKKYALRLFIFALISEIPFNLALGRTFFAPEYQNVFFTLLFGFLTIWFLEKVEDLSYHFPLQILIILGGCAAAYLFKTDYDAKGVILIVILYLFRCQRSVRTVLGCLSLLWEPAACLAFIPIHFYDGTKGISLKYFFYLFYPVHILIFTIISFMIAG